MGTYCIHVTKMLCITVHFFLAFHFLALKTEKVCSQFEQGQKNAMKMLWKGCIRSSVSIVSITDNLLKIIIKWIKFCSRKWFLLFTIRHVKDAFQWRQQKSKRWCIFLNASWIFPPCSTNNSKTNSKTHQNFRGLRFAPVVTASVNVL